MSAALITVNLALALGLAGCSSGGGHGAPSGETIVAGSLSGSFEGEPVEFRYGLVQAGGKDKSGNDVPEGMAFRFSTLPIDCGSSEFRDNGVYLVADVWARAPGSYDGTTIQITSTHTYQTYASGVGSEVLVTSVGATVAGSLTFDFADVDADTSANGTFEVKGCF